MSPFFFLLSALAILTFTAAAIDFLLNKQVGGSPEGDFPVSMRSSQKMTG